MRIFEPRYLSMVGDCMRNQSPFGVVLISDGKEAGEAAQFHEIGTLAMIEDFDQLEDGHLGLSCRGDKRFSVIRHQVQSDELITAEINLLKEEITQNVPDKYPSMVTFLRDLYERDEFKARLTENPPQWQDGEWLGCRISEILPLSIESRQALLEMPCSERLNQLFRVMQENNLIKLSN